MPSMDSTTSWRPGQASGSGERPIPGKVFTGLRFNDERSACEKPLGMPLKLRWRYASKTDRLCQMSRLHSAHYPIPAPFAFP